MTIAAIRNDARVQQLLPFLKWLPLVNGATVRADLFAGFTNATIVLPQAIAFAAIAGLPPEYGLYTAMITPIVAALFGSSMIMISGPTTAISAVVFSAVSNDYTPGTTDFVQVVLLLTVIVGVFQVLLGLARLGRLVAFVSHSVMIGFTAAAAVLIAVSQAGDALGFAVERGVTIVDTLQDVIAKVGLTDWRTVAISMSTLACVVVLRIYLPRVPGFLLGLALGAVVCWTVEGSQHGIRMVGALPAPLPAFHPPPFDLGLVAKLSESAFAIALIGLLEAISIGRAFAFKAHVRFDANQEIVGQGLSNFVGGFFQAYPGSGSFTRSGINYEAGAVTPLSAIFSSIFLFVLLLFLAPLAALIPIPAMAGIILYVAWKLIDFSEIHQIFHTSKSETMIIAATAIAGLAVKLEFAIYVGVILSLLIFISKASRPDLAISAPDENHMFRNVAVHKLPECPQLVVARPDGALYFGSVESLEHALRAAEKRRPEQKHLLLYLKGIGDIDLAGANLVCEEADRRRARGGALYIIARYPPRMKRLRKLNVIDRVGEERIFDNKGQAISTIVPQLDGSICANCRARVFFECSRQPGGSDWAKARKAEDEPPVKSGKMAGKHRTKNG